MSEPWFFCPDLHAGRLDLDDAETRHALRSLRLRPGDPLVLFDGQGGVARATISPPPEPGRDAQGRPRRRPVATAVLVEAIERIAPPSRRLTLIVAGCKGTRLSWLVEKSTELGVSRLVVAEFERSVVHTLPRDADQLRRTAIEACKQSRRAWLPEIVTGVPLATAIEAAAGTYLLIAHLADGAAPLATCLRDETCASRALTAVIGPEGGLAPLEIEEMQAAGGRLVRLGQFVLRVETAALAVAANWAAAVADDVRTYVPGTFHRD